MRKLFLYVVILLALASTTAAQQQGGTISPTLKVSDGTKSFNGVTELRFPVGCVTFSNRTAVITCSSGSSSSTGSSQNGNLFYASPNGSYGLPSWRAIVEADVPNLSASKISSGTIATARLGSGTANGTTYLRGDQTWATITTSSGTVESVALSLPSLFSVTGSPVTTTGTLTATLADQNANKVLAGPVSGADAAPTFRTLVEADIPTLSQSKVTNLVTDLAGKQASDSDLTAIAGLSTTGIVTRTGTGTATTRTITGTANQVTVANGDGVSGNPTLSLPQSIATTSSVRFGSLGVGVTPDPSMAFEVAGSSRLTASGGNAPAYFIGGSGSVEMWPGAIGSGVGKAFGSAVPGTAAGNDLIFSIYNAGWVERLRINQSGNVVVGSPAALATTATDGFLYIPTTAGTPTGVPTTFTGKVALVYNTAGNQLCVYLSPSWRCF